MPVHLIASSDEYLLEERLREVVRSASEAFGGVEPEILDEEITPEDLATTLCSPSLFAPQRLLVLHEIRSWLEGPSKNKKGKARNTEAMDATPVVKVLEEGLSEDVALILGAHHKSRPRGSLVDAVEAAGTFEWQNVPDPPKPWEDVTVSQEQEKVLRQVLARAAGDVAFSEAALRLLMDRLGYEPRLLVQEAKKLAAASEGGAVDEDLVRALCFPRERSLEVVRDAVFARRPEPILDLVKACEAGDVVRDWRGGILDAKSLPLVVAGQVGSLFQQMLYIRRMAARIGMEQELTPERTSVNRWYPSRFKNGFGPALLEHLKNDAPSPVMVPGRRPPSLFSLGHVVKGAGSFEDDELIAALAEFGRLEAATRGDMRAEALSIWLTRALSAGFS